MATIKIKKGLDIPISGALPHSNIVNGPFVRRVALVPRDYPGIKVKMLVKEGDSVDLGTPLFCDRRDEHVLFTSPAGGTVVAINRGARRKVMSVVVEIGGKETQARQKKVTPETATRDEIKEALMRSGLWACLRQRPFDRVAPSNGTPAAIFVTCVDTNPLAPKPQAIIAEKGKEFRTGLLALAKLTDGTCYVCAADGDDAEEYLPTGNIESWRFAGPHPAGNVGLHIHKLRPVGANTAVWHVGYQDVIAIGQFLRTTRIPTERVAALVGPGVTEPRIVRTRRGVAIEDLFGEGGVTASPARYVSGSVLAGKTANPDSMTGFLGAYDNQVTVLEDAAPRRFMGWAGPGFDSYSITNVFAGKFIKKNFAFNTDTNGSLRAVVPIGTYESVMPMDILPTFLIKAMLSKDWETCEKLGVLELVEDDMALCAFVCPSKIDINGLLRDTLEQMEKEGLG
ncbi:MAG: Na(+)-translocating NADH-quinone reductase subunit A [Deltaproteobacteria bacterium]|nr:Na(+)-translocating NADH-quinone reductase subunit A [Deltaproteobacteria bacterium]MCB9490289.1 Na(+)-translocating NADH-quinone reductase subunit A [Deltaproteobacteria bacterium]